MLEDLLNVVKKRFNDDDSDKNENEKPTYKCPRCQETILLEHLRSLKESARNVTTTDDLMPVTE